MHIGQIVWTSESKKALVKIIKVKNPPNYKGKPCVLAELLHNFWEWKAGDRGFYIIDELLPFNKNERI